MKHLFFLIGMLCGIAMCRAQDGAGDSLRLSVVADGLCATLTWEDEAVTGGCYTIYRRYPGEEGFDSIDTACQRSYHYCLPRQVCGDTVLFRVTRWNGSQLLSGTAGESFDDRNPTSGCEVDRVTVDGASQQIRLSWHPSPDKDIMGYYICTGKPCTDYDTVWGRQDTTYLCVDHEVNDTHVYRVLAFDSCFRASPLTPYYGNLVLKVSAPECSRTATFSWNEYLNMPQGMGCYILTVEMEPTGERRCDTLAFNAVRSVTMTLDDEVSLLRATVTAVSSDRELRANSNEAVWSFDSIEMSRYVTITQCEYDMRTNAVLIGIEADSDFVTEGYTLYRAADSGEYEVLAWLPYSPDGRVSYADHDIHLTEASRYFYRVGVADRCGVREKRSGTVVVTLPSTDMRGAFFPNIFTPLRVENNRFCPSYRFVEQEYYELAIYDRMGMKVFGSTDPLQCWDGTLDGQTLPQGIYVYQVRCRYIDGALDDFRGTVLLLK